MAERDIFEELMEGMKHLADHRRCVEEYNATHRRSEPATDGGVKKPESTDL